MSNRLPDALRYDERRPPPVSRQRGRLPPGRLSRRTARPSLGRVTLGILLASMIGCGAPLESERAADEETAVRTEPTQTGSRQQPECTVNDILVPSCGAWWGVSPGEDSLADLEEEVGRSFDLVYHWHGIDQIKIPDTQEVRESRAGHYLHLNIESRRFNESGHPVVAYSDVAGGEYDSALRAQAVGLRKLGEPVFVTFEHEVDADDKAGVRGSPAEFVAAWQHVHDVYRDNGAANVIWVWVVTGWKGNFHKVGALYPGDAYVDWISWEGYNSAGCRSGSVDWSKRNSFEEAIRPFYRWLRTTGAEQGIDASKPYMISEAGSVIDPEEPRLTARWWQGVVPTLKQYPQIHAIQLWNGKTSAACDYRVTNERVVLDAFAKAGHDPYVNQEHGQ